MADDVSRPGPSGIRSRAGRGPNAPGLENVALTAERPTAAREQDPISVLGNLR